MQLEAPRNKNYAAVVVALSKFNDLPNCDNVRAALIFGNSVIVSKDTQPGAVGLFFPVETALSKEFAGASNLFRKPEWGNVDATKKGFFEEHGRVKAVKFRGHKSEGFWIPVESLAYTGISVLDLPIGAEFDKIGEHEICTKYVPRRNAAGAPRTRDARQPRLEDRIIEGQFRFHYDTENLRRNIHQIKPDQYVSVSSKWHGTSVVVSRILVKRELRWFERLLTRLGVAIQDAEYGLTWSSRRVIKGIDGDTKSSNVHYYGADIWGTVAKEVQDCIPKGFTLYGEIVGFTEDGAAIQKGYHYGCQPKTHRLVVYRVTTTNADGKVIELSWPQMREFCTKYGLEMVKEFFYGRATDLYAFDGGDVDAWQQGLLAALESRWVRDEMCPFNNHEVPAEGIVVRVEAMDEAPAYKLKNFAFLSFESKELDKGEVDIETAEAET